MAENYLFGTEPVATNPIRVIEVKILTALNGGAGGGGGGSGTGGSGFTGVGSPEGVVTATPGTSYLDTAGDSLWYKESGSGNTGWIQLIA